MKINKSTKHPPGEGNLSWQDMAAGSVMKETTLEADCKEWLTHNGCVIVQTHSGYRKPAACGTPDLIGCTRAGRAIVVETKKPGRKASPNQEWTLSRFRERNAIVIVPRSLDELMAEYAKQTESGWDAK